jgi:hypothetical protein
MPTPYVTPGGTYASARSVVMTDTVASATIYYTINGSTPTTSSNKYTAPITVSTSETVKAISLASGYEPSAVASSSFTIQNGAAAPVFSLLSGTYTGTHSTSITDTTSGATIYYTTNGTTPTASSAKYGGAISVSSSETVEAIAIAPGVASSPVATAKYTILLYMPAPYISPGGTFSTARNVGMSDTVAGAVIYYTADGTTPTTSSNKYTSPITVSSSEIVKAISVASGYAPSAVASSSFTISK